MKRNEKNQKPHGVYVVEGEGDQEFWTRVGAAWPHQDGKGFGAIAAGCSDSRRTVAPISSPCVRL
ncbi:hypothetical protein AB7M74_010767 [Bradyrhizobium japonicum]